MKYSHNPLKSGKSCALALSWLSFFFTIEAVQILKVLNMFYDIPGSYSVKTDGLKEASKKTKQSATVISPKLNDYKKRHVVNRPKSLF